MLRSTSHLAGSLPRRPIIIGIRREDLSRIWERRAPLTPDAVANLVGNNNVEVEVVKCDKRVFTDTEYEKAGAKLVNRLSKPNIILGIKEPSLSQLDEFHASSSGHASEPTHLMFSHTIKGQAYNMPLLAKFLKPKSSSTGRVSKIYRRGEYPRLIDYELIKDEAGKRTVGFGWFAGAAGVLEGFSAMAQQHLENGVASPFLYTCRPYMHRTLDDMRKNLRDIGVLILDQGFSERLGPFVIGLTGTGNVSQGVLDMLKELPLTVISPEDLPALMEGGYNNRTIYLVHAKPADYLQRDDEAPYNREDYYQNPDKYKSVFHNKIAQYLTLFINGAGWSPNYPRLMTHNQLLSATVKALKHGGFRLMNIADISCDIKGGLEFLDKSTTLSSPFYDISRAFAPPLRMMAVDILPTSMPLDASNHFSTALLPYLSELIQQQQSLSSTGSESPKGAYATALEKATIAENGELTKQHEWLRSRVEAYLPLEEPNISRLDVDAGRREEKPLPEVRSSVEVNGLLDIARGEINRKKSERKRVLMLGSGMVAQPAVDYLVCKCDAELTIASNNQRELKQLAQPYPHRVETKCVDFDDPRKYEALIAAADVVLSLLPAAMHHKVADICISVGKPLVTTSYQSHEMEQLNTRAEYRGVLVLNEMGLDPGMDHLSAASLINKLLRERRRLLSFASMCGGLPAPQDASDVPLKYKFSWRPEGVLIAAMQDALYVLLGEYYRIHGDDLLDNYWPKLPIVPGMELEGLPNRNSVLYAKVYRLGGMRTFVRGTLRYPGYSSLLHSFKKLGLLNNTKQILPQGWNTLVRESMLAKYDSEDGFIPSLPEVIPAANLQVLHEALEWLGLATPSLYHHQHYHLQDTESKFKPQQPMPPLPLQPATPLSIFAYLLSQKLRYESTDKDMVILSHEIITEDRYFVKHPNSAGPRRAEQVHTSTLVTYGTDTMHTSFYGERPTSAMARMVGFPAAIAAMLIAQGKIQLTGVRRPVDREIYKPVLKELEEIGIEMEEKTREVQPVVRDSKERKKEVVGPAASLVDKNSQNTVEGALAVAVDLPEEKRMKLEDGEAEDKWILDLDSDKGWEEEEYVEWPEKRGRE